jgi:hypothetical protein
MLPASESVASKNRAISSLTFPRLYVALALLQAAHSAEEYFTRFYERIREGSSLLHEVIPFVPVFEFSEKFFVTVNVVLIVTIMAFILLIYHGGLLARLQATLLAIIEFVNGVAHLTIAVMMGGYFPGALTAPFLIVVSVLLLRRTWTPNAPQPRVRAGHW